MSVATGNPVFETVGGDASAATVTPTGGASSVTLADVAAAAQTAASDASSAKQTATSASSTANSASTTANTALSTANAASKAAGNALQPSAIGETNGVVGIDANGQAVMPNGANIAGAKTGGVGIGWGNMTAATSSIYNWYFLQGTTTTDVTVQLWGGTAGTSGLGNIAYSAASLAPAKPNATALGTAGLPWSGIASQTAVQVISDLNDKNIVGGIGASDFTDETTKLLAVWADISGYVFYLKDGQSGRKHIGVIAQYIADAFKKQGLDAAEYGVWCSTLKTKLVDKKDENGNPYCVEEPIYLEDGVTQATQETIRYEELLSLGLFCEKLERAELTARIAAIESQASSQTSAA